MSEISNNAFTDEEVKKITEKVMEVNQANTGIKLEYEGDLLKITKAGKLYKLSEHEQLTLCVFLDTFQISLEVHNTKNS